MTNALMLLLAAAAFGVVGVAFVLFFNRQNARAPLASDQPAPMPGPLTDSAAKAAGRAKDRRTVEIETICQAFPEFADLLRQHLNATPSLDPDKVRAAIEAARAGQPAPAPDHGAAVMGSAGYIPESQGLDILAALKIVAGSDDGATHKDGTGFNREHTEIGTRLAALPKLSQAEAAVGRDLVRFYKRQIAATDGALYERAVAGVPTGLCDLSRAALEARLGDANETPLPDLHGPPAQRRAGRL